MGKIKRGIKKILTTVSRGYINGTCRIAGVFGYRNLMDDYMKSLCKQYEKSSDYYVAYKIRPKTEKKIFTIEEENSFDSQVAIIMQGPIFREEHFTLETVKIYKKLFPSAKVFVSTWKDQDEKEIELLRAEPNCEIVFCEKPEEPGAVNANMQMVSTLCGIRKAKEEGYKYVLKTRGDWRIYAKGALRFMIHLLDEFPCSNTSFHQNKRIIATDIATEETSIMFYPYWITDLLMFGEINDMELYWSSEMMDKSEYNKVVVNRTIRSKHYTWKRRIQEGLLNETRIPMNYIKRMTGKEPDISVEGYWNFLKDYCMIVPKSLLDAFWFKYTDRRENESSDWGTCFINDSQEMLLTYNFDFVTWMNLYSNDFKYKKEYEKICEKRYYEYRRHN